MTEPGGTSRAAARRRAVEASRRENEARAEREKANVKDAAIILHALDRLAEIAEWKKQRLADLRARAAAQAEKEAAKKQATEHSNAGEALARMRDRGETLTTIASTYNLGVGAVRSLARHAPKSDKSLPRNGSHALGLVGSVDQTPVAMAPEADEPPDEAASA